MRISKTIIAFLCLIGFISTGESYKFDFDLVVGPTPGGISFNAVCYVPGTDAYNLNNRYFAVGDMGWVYILSNDGNTVASSQQLNAEYNLSSVSGFRYGNNANDVLVITVGYKRETTPTGPKWKGAIWRSLDRGRTWTRVLEENFPQNPQFQAVPVPFLDVKVVDRQNVWVSCGNGYVMRSNNGGVSWFLTENKPVRPNYFGWYWGIWAPSATQAWVCSDESTIVARTVNGGQTWTIYSPFALDSVSIRDIYGDQGSPGTIYLVTSKGYLVYTTNYGANWHKDTPLNMDPPAEWLRGVFSHKPPSPPFGPTDKFVWCVGTGGIIANNEELGGNELIWYSRKYDFNAIDGGCVNSTITQNRFTYVAVGTNRTIMSIKAYPEDYGTFTQREQNIRDELVIGDWLWDDGWKIWCSWEEYEDAEDWYRLYILPAPDMNNHYLREMTDWGKRIAQVPIQGPLYVEYDSILIGYNTTFTVTTNEDGEETEIYYEDGMSLDDRDRTYRVTGFSGIYNSDLDAAVLQWNPVPSTDEPNLGGYWICPVINGVKRNINHPAPLLRTFYIESVPPGIPRPFDWGFDVQAMDRSGDRGSWQPSYYFIHIPGRPNSPYATAFTQGRHLVRVPNTKELHMVNETNGKVIYSYSVDNGETWTEGIIDNGLYPCIGINYKQQPWIAYIRDSDLICKMKRQDGSWKEILIYDGNETRWAGPPSMVLATMPIKEGVKDYAYITYAVYEGTMPEGPSEQPPQNISASFIYLTLFDTLELRAHILDMKSDPNVPLSHPCVGVTPADLIHIVWQQKDEIWYITNQEKITPENWKEVQWTQAYNLSNTTEISEHPFVESYGDIVSVVWKEGEPGEIIRKKRYAWEPSEYEKWKDPENLSNSPDFDSDYPQMSAGDVTLWQEADAEGKYKVYANIQGKILNLIPDANNVSYAHANALVIDPKEPRIQVYYCYTDEITDNELYEVKFDKYLFPEGITGEVNEIKYYDGLIGAEIASPYCELRTGYIDYGDYTIDYGNQLEYKLKYLDPCKHYQFQAIVYQDTTGIIRQRLEVEDTLEATMRVYRAEPETINIYISPNSYQEDLESALEIIKTRGLFATIADFKVYEYEVISDSGSGGSGPQNVGLERLPIPTMLSAPKPNPFTNRTEIRFQIPVKTRVDLKIYNSLGRLINTLANDEMNPGYYTMSWNGKDAMNRTQSNGIYFIRLKTKDYDETKKMILMK